MPRSRWDATATGNASCSTAVVNAVVLNPGQPKGQQIFVCHDNGDGTKSWYGVNDESDLQAQIAALTTNSADGDSADCGDHTARKRRKATLTTNLNNEIGPGAGSGKACSLAI